MKNPKTSLKTVAAVLCVILLLCAFAVQFVPFWSAEGSVSIAGYVWFPTDHGDLTDHFEQNIAADFDVESLVLYSIIQLLVPVAAIALAAAQRNPLWLAIGAGVTGLSGIWSLCTKAVLRQGSIWPGMLVISIALVFLTAVYACACGQEGKNSRQEEKGSL